MTRNQSHPKIPAGPGEYRGRPGPDDLGPGWRWLAPAALLGLVAATAGAVRWCAVEPESPAWLLLGLCVMAWAAVAEDRPLAPRAKP